MTAEDAIWKETKRRILASSLGLPCAAVWELDRDIAREQASDAYIRRTDGQARWAVIYDQIGETRC